MLKVCFFRERQEEEEAEEEEEGKKYPPAIKPGTCTYLPSGSKSRRTGFGTLSWVLTYRRSREPGFGL